MTPPFSSSLAVKNAPAIPAAKPVQMIVAPAVAPSSTRVPRHLAMVVDARHLGDPAAPAHSLEAMRDLVCGCLEHGVEWLSVFVPEELVRDNAAFDALEEFIRTQGEALALWGIRLSALTPSTGSGQAPLTRAEKLLGAIRDAGAMPLEEEKLRLTLAVNYDGRAELLQAIKHLADEAAAGRLAPRKLSAETLERNLFQRGLPPVDLLIRTGGNRSLSSFLLWHAAYAELLFISEPFTLFRRQHLEAALSDYARRSRTFGALPK